MLPATLPASGRKLPTSYLRTFDSQQLPNLNVKSIYQRTTVKTHCSITSITLLAMLLATIPDILPAMLLAMLPATGRTLPTSYPRTFASHQLQTLNAKSIYQ